MNDFIQKEIIKERTGAGVSPITVDTQSRFLINSSGVPSIQLGATPDIPVHKNMFLETLGDIVKDAEKTRINNNKFELDLQLKKMDLDFKEKWNKDKNRYTDNYDNYLKDFEKLYVEKEKLIMGNKFLDIDEKRHIKEKLTLNKIEDRTEIGTTRDKIYVQNQLEKTQALITQSVEMASSYGINEDNKAKELYKYIADARYNQQKLTGMDDEKVLVLLGGDIANAETNRLSNEISRIMNSDSSIQYKEQELKKLQSYFENDNAYNILTHEIVDNYYKGEDKEKAYEYIKIKIKGNIKSLMKQTRSSLKELNRYEKRVSLEKLLKRQNAINQAYNDFDFSKMEKALSNQVIKFDDRIASEIQAIKSGNYNNSSIVSITGKTPLKIINDGEYIKNFLPQEQISNLQKEVDNLVIQGNDEGMAIVKVAKDMAQGNRELTNIIVNSITSKGGYSKSVDIALRAVNGDNQALEQLQQINSIQRTRQRATKDTQLTNEETKIFTDGLEGKVTKLADKTGIHQDTARKVITELVVGKAYISYDDYNEKKFIYNEEDRLSKLDSNWFSNGYSIGIIKKNVGELLDNDVYFDSLASTLQPRKKLRAVELRGVKK